MEHDAVLQVAIYQLRFDELDSAGEVIPTCTTDDAALFDDRYDPIAGLSEPGADQALGQAPCGVLQADFVLQRWNDEMIRWAHSPVPISPSPSVCRAGGFNDPFDCKIPPDDSFEPCAVSHGGPQSGDRDHAEVYDRSVVARERTRAELDELNADLNPAQQRDFRSMKVGIQQRVNESGMPSFSAVCDSTLV